MLLIEGDEDRAALLHKALSPFFTLVTVKDARQAELILAEVGFDAILAAGSARETLSGLTGRGALLLTLGDGEDPAREGIYALPDLSEESVEAALRHVTVTRALLSGLRREKDALQKRLEDMALQNRAKAVLCRTLGFSEEQAHKYLEKQAMTLRITKTDAARRIVATYEN